ncbi:MAG: hypothetical protein AB8F26_00970 [Phycisphaerales bacterium]
MTEPPPPEPLRHPLTPWQPTFRVSQIRTIAAIMAGYQTLTVCGLWMLAGQDVPFVHTPGGGLATLIALVLTVRFAVDARRAKPITHTEKWRAVLLSANPLWPGIPLLIGSELIRDGWDIAYITTAMIGILVFHTIPGLILADAFKMRVGKSDDSWRPHHSTQSERSGALHGLSIVASGWCGAFGLIAALTRYEFDPSVGLRDALYALGLSHFGYALGMVLGFFAALFTATIPAQTWLDRSVLPLFSIPFTLGVVGSAVNPIIGVLAAVLGAIGSSIYVSKRHPIVQPGRCHACDYSLRGLTTETCPECGTDNRKAQALAVGQVAVDSAEPDDWH